MSSDSKPRPQLTVARKLAFSAMAAAILFLMLEAALRLMGSFPESAAFSEFQGDDGRAMARFNLESPFPSFPRRKPAGTLRIFIAGASSVVGFPFQPRSSIGKPEPAAAGRVTGHPVSPSRLSASAAGRIQRCPVR